MGHNLTTFYWTTTPTVPGTGQLDEGPFHLGVVTKLFRAEVRGQINYQGVTQGVGSVTFNAAAWGLQQIPHGNTPMDVITSGDSDYWLMRRQTGSDDYVMTWAPSTDDAAVLVVNEVADDWAGQLVNSGDTDIWLSIKTSYSGYALPALATFGTIRLWWT